MSIPPTTPPSSAAPAAPDAALLAKATGGDQMAMIELLRRHGPTVRSRIATKISPIWQSMIEPDDVLQVTYVEAVMDIGRFQPRHEGSFLAWLTLLAENNLRDAIKELDRAKRPSPRKRVESGPSDESYVALVELMGVTLTTPSIQAAKGEIKTALDAALDRMPPDYARVIRLYDLAGRSIEDVATDMGKSHGAVFMLRARAHDRLKQTLGNESQFFSRTS